MNYAVPPAFFIEIAPGVQVRSMMGHTAAIEVKIVTDPLGLTPQQRFAGEIAAELEALAARCREVPPKVLRYTANGHHILRDGVFFGSMTENEDAETVVDALNREDEN